MSHTPQSAESLPTEATDDAPAEWLTTFETDLQPPVRRREFLAVALCVVLADVVIYRGHGYAGYAALFALTPLLLLLGSPRPRVRWSTALLVDVMLMTLALRMVWLGSDLLLTCGVWLLVAFAMALAGQTPYVLSLVGYAVRTIPAGVRGLRDYGRAMKWNRNPVSAGGVLKVVLPIVAAIGFGTLFVLANPDVTTAFANAARQVFEFLQETLDDLVPTWIQVLLWIAVAWGVIGLLRPSVRKPFTTDESEHADAGARNPSVGGGLTLYAAYRNMLLTVIVLFAGYLVFEFKTLWFREFPKGFYYSGYAHEGAAWLTIALALATLVLSFVFRGRLAHDPRLRRLQALAWIWSAENVLLALAVYNRLFIYVGFNGMTRMRMVGLFGMSAVLVGFLLVVWKIHRGRDFVWLLRRQLWALALAVLLFALTPVDAIVHTYNVRRILAGDPAPSVQISVHPIDSGGMMVLLPLIDCGDEIIREGVRAMLAARADELTHSMRRGRREGWTSFQLADRQLLQKLDGIRSDWERYENKTLRAAALARFHEYAYQWY